MCLYRAQPLKNNCQSWLAACPRASHKAFMKTHRFDITGPVLFVPKKHEDSRGAFMETFRRDIFAQATGCNDPFVQDNRSVSENAGTLRGLHAQTPPRAQGKLISVVAGAIFDVATDIRKASPTFGRSVSLKLSPDNGAQFWIPPGFLHGFVTLAPRTIVSYKCTDYYSADHEITIAWNDPVLAIDWATDAPVLSAKDASARSFANFNSPF